MSMAVAARGLSFLEGMGIFTLGLGVDKSANEGRLSASLVKLLTGVATVTAPLSTPSTLAPSSPNPPQIVYLPSSSSSLSGMIIYPSLLVGTLYLSKSHLLPVTKAALSDMSER